MFDLALLPYLQADGSTSRLKACLDRRVLHTFGLIEAEVDRRLQGLLPNGSEVRLGMLASPLGVSVSLTACGETSAERASVMDRAVRAVRARLRRYIYAEGDETMEQVVGRQLSRLGLQVAVAESCTGGLIGHRLTQVPGSSAYFDRGVISYSNEAKQDLLGVPIGLLRRYGAVSAEVAAAMAAGIRARSRADVGLSITGIAGPCGGTERKPVGLVYVGLDAQGRSKTSGRSMRIAQEFRFHGDRSTIKLRSSQAALNVLRRWLMTSKRSVS
jgi:nicotinamide-nucleotide amidase